VYETVWSADGNRLFVRYLRDDNTTIRTFAAKVSSSTRPETALEGIFLSDGIREISVSGNRAFYFTSSGNAFQGLTSNLDGSGKTAVFTTSYGDWSSLWSSPSTITLFTRPSGYDEGSAYILNPSTGNYSKVLGGLAGLTALANSDGSLVLASTGGNNSIRTMVYAAKDSSIANLSVAALADKCVWSKKNKEVAYCASPNSVPNGIYPDDWYKGKVSFEDSLWKINTVTGETEEMLNPVFESGVSMDIMKPSLDQDERVILFTNKKDMTVWRYDLKAI
jgi:hypothetical protein